MEPFSTSDAGRRTIFLNPASSITDPVPLCSIVIPTYNGRALLETCLASVFRHLPAGRPWATEVIVVDDASTDCTVNWLAAHHPQVRLVCRSANGGFCAAANDGLDAASGQFIQLLNNDTEVTPGWLEAGLAPFADPLVGSVAPLVLVRSDPSRVDSAGDAYTLGGWPTKRGHGQPASRWIERPLEDVFAASGSSAFYRAAGDPSGWRLRLADGLVLRGRRRWLPAPLGRVSLRLQFAVPDSARDLRNFRSRCPRTPAPDRPQRGTCLLVEPSHWPPRRRHHSPRRAFDHPRRLANVSSQVHPLLSRQDRRSPQRPRHSARRKLRADLARSSIAPAHFPVEIRFGRRRPQPPSPTSPSIFTQASSLTS